MLSYRPDDDPYNDGILTGLSNAIPTNKGGYQHAFDSTDLTYTSLPGTCIGSNFLIRLDGSARLFAGTDTRIYEADQTTSGTGQWTNVSATTYATASSWTFAQFGNVSLAASYENRLQFSNGAKGTAFADVSGAPNAKIVYTLGKRVILLNTSGYTGSGQDGWAASSEGDYFTSTFWPPAATNNAAFGTLNEVGGPLLAGCSLGSLAIAWKSQGMWIGQDQGPPLQITWQKIPGNYGIVGTKAWCYIQGGVFFVSSDDAFIFDGSRPISVTDGVKETLFGGLSASIAASSTSVECEHDDYNNCVYIFFKTLFVTLVYNYRTRVWGRISGYRGTTNETIQATIALTNAQAANIYGLTQANANSSMRVFAGNKLRQLGTDNMRSGTTAVFDFNWFRAQRGSLYYKNLYFRAPTLANATLSGFANLDTSAGALTANTEYQRLDAKYSGIILKPRMTVTPSGTASFEFTGFNHDMKQEGVA